MQHIKNQVWAKTRFFTRNNVLHSVTTLVLNGSPKTFRLSIPLEPIDKALRAYHQRMHADDAASVSGSVWSDMKKTGRAIGRSKLVKRIHNTSKSVIKSNITAGVFATAAVVFPPAGVPALAAYAATRTAVEGVDEADRQIRKYKKAGRDAKRMLGLTKKASKKIKRTALKKRGGFKVSAKIRRALMRMPYKKRVKVVRRLIARRLKTNVRSRLVIARGIAAMKMLAYASSPRGKTRLRKAIKKKKRILGAVSRMKKMARRGTPAQRVDATKRLAILTLVAKENRRIKDIAKNAQGGTRGVLISERGGLVPGTYARSQGAQGVLYTPGGYTRGRYAAIAGCACI